MTGLLPRLVCCYLFFVIKSNLLKDAAFHNTSKRRDRKSDVCNKKKDEFILKHLIWRGKDQIIIFNKCDEIFARVFFSRSMAVHDDANNR